MNARPLIAALAVLALLGAAAPLASTQAAEIGEGVEIRPVDGPNGAYAQVGDDGQVSIQLDTDAAVPGEGLPADTELDFDRVFLILNANDAGDAEGRQAYVYVRDEGSGADNVSFYRGGDTDSSIEGQDNAVRLDTGESADVGFTVDTDDGDDLESGDLTITVEAAVSQLADAALDVVPERPTAGEAVEFDASGSVGDRLEYEYDFDDGTIAADAGPTQEHVFDDPGTYNVTLAVNETAARAPNGSDSVTRRVVVRGPPQTAGSGEAITIPNAESGSDRPAVRSVTADLAGASPSARSPPSPSRTPPAATRRRGRPSSARPTSRFRPTPTSTPRSQSRSTPRPSPRGLRPPTSRSNGTTARRGRRSRRPSRVPAAARSRSSRRRPASRRSRRR